VVRLCSWCKRLRIYSREGWIGANLARLTDLVRISPEVIEEQIVMGHEDFFRGKKLPFNQNCELIRVQLVPDLVSRSAGLRFPGHQNQLSGEDVANISINLTP